MTGKRFQDQVVVVTGAARGIGFHTALRFAREGARVVVNDLDPAAVDLAVDRIATEGGSAFGVACDASDDQQVARAVRQVCEQAGRIDVLVNNAGIHGIVPSQQLQPQAWRRVMGVNLDGPFYWSQAVAVASMLPRRAGAIVNLASGAGLASIPNSVAYVASKHGLVGLTRALALDWGPYNVRVNAVAPGLTWTELARQGQAENPGMFAQREQRIPLGHAADPDDQADAILFLASAQAKSINGSILVVDGGTHGMSAGYSVQPVTD
jgi:NAD(P)-dependent dehydrogenase (short-subunit alcohol dehydrogenase family)